jgi:predicted PurR-regulated permease PerM
MDYQPPSPGRFAAVTGSSLTPLLVAAVIVSGLYFGREILVPLTLSVLLSFVLAPLVRLLQRLFLPRFFAVVVVVAIAFAAILGLGAVMVTQVNQLASDLPQYQTTLREKIQSLRGAAAGTGTLERASEVLQNLQKELDPPKSNTNPSRPVSGSAAEIEKPVPVEVKQPDPGALQTVVALIAPLIHPLTTTGLVIIFVVFILVQRQDLRNRLIRLAGARDLQRTTAAMDDAGERLSRLFLTQLALNACFGVVIGVGLWLIGVPSAPLWGMLAMILRFVPYIGALIAAVFPLVLAAAVGQSWSMVLWTAALFAVVEPIVGHGIEPLLYGQSTGLSPVAVVASATFWTWLWGPVGLILATPLTVCLVVMGRHVDQLKFLDVMFGDQPALTPPELAYQRMLAGDPVEAAEQAMKFAKDKPLIEYYQNVLIEGLTLAEIDARRGLLTHERQLRVRDSVAEVLDDLGSYSDDVKKIEAQGNLVSSDRPNGSLVPTQGEPTSILCIPGLGLIDEAATLILAHVIKSSHVSVRTESADALSVSRFFGLDAKGVSVFCLCYVEAVTPAHIRYSVRRIRRKAPEAFILIAILGDLNASIATDQLPISANIEVAKTLADTVIRVSAYSQREVAAFKLKAVSTVTAAAGA